MKIALFDEWRLGVAASETELVDVTAVAGWDPAEPQRSLVSLMARFDTLRGALAEAAAQGPRRALADVRLRPPVPEPSLIVAAPVNYVRHQEEMSSATTIEQLGFFLKAPVSIIGPGDTIRLPYRDRRTDHEAELGFVIGRRAKDVPAAEGLSYIFGYFGLIDVTVRGKEDRPMRKSFDTFTPIGPWIVTADEVGDPNALGIRLWVNDELRQDANTRDLIYNCQRLVELASSVLTLRPGDIVATGTPEGVGPIRPGDTVTLEIEKVGRFSVGVAARER